MKALALDTSLTKITVCAKNGGKTACLTLDIGMRQSEKLLPAIDALLSHVELDASELDYTAICKGPGSFTGLRLGFSALKAIELAYNVPVYGVGTLECYSYAYRNFPVPVVCAVDAKKDRFYVRVESNGEVLVEDGDFEVDEIREKLLETDADSFFVCGSDAKMFASHLNEKPFSKKLFYTHSSPNETENLFALTETMIEKKIPALKEFEGPVYIRASEAEEKLTLKANS